MPKQADIKIAEIRRYLKNKIINSKVDDYVHKKERKQIHDLLKRTVETGESNSALLIGPRGVGKTTLIKSVVKELNEIENFKVNAILVHLHGLVHTDDRLALKSATSQMNLDNAVDGKVFGSFAENLAFLLACLKTGKQETSKSVIFILDEFDLFCSHHNQTLLYNLFDISQSAQTPICVLGLTCRLDVIELLEKRVKSRFSHRQIFLFAGEEDSDNSNIDIRLKKIESFLKVEDDSNIPLAAKKQWNNSVKDLINDKKFGEMMQFLMDIDTNEQILKNMLIVIISRLNEDYQTITAKDFKEEINNLDKDETICTLQDLSTLELCVLIAMKHHMEIYDNQPMNFEMIYTRYTKFSNRNSNMQSLERSVVMKAFEHLNNLELICPITSGTGRLQKEYQMFKLLVSSQQINEAVKKWHGLPTEVVQWANSSLV